MLLIVPGLTGHGDELYCKNSAQAALSSGFDVCVTNHRGGSKTPLTSPKLYCAGSSWDFKEALSYLSQKYPQKQFYAIGFSLGANILGKYQAEEGKESRLKAAVCVNGPMDMLAASRHLERMWFGMFSKVLAGNIKRRIEEHEDCLAMIEEAHEIDVKRELRRSRSLKEVDHHVTSRLFGFESADEYYEKTGCGQMIHKIRSPTLFIQSKDDTIVGGNCYPQPEEFLKNENTVLLVTQAGGHIGYYESIFSKKQWFTKPMLEFFKLVQ